MGFAQKILTDFTEKGVTRLHPLGHSMGGMIVQQMATMAPERTNRLALYGTRPPGVMPDRFETIDTSHARLRADGTPDTARRIAATWFAQGNEAAGYPLCAKLGETVSEQTALGEPYAMETWDGRAACPTSPKRPWWSGAIATNPTGGLNQKLSGAASRTAVCAFCHATPMPCI